MRSLAHLPCALLVAASLGCGAPPARDVGTSATRAPAETLGDAIAVSLAHRSAREDATRARLLALVARYDLGPWLVTRRVVVDERALPHSHPVLTLSTAHLAVDDLLLASLLHEEAHWRVDAQPQALERALAELVARFPGLPVGPPDGAATERASYVHLLVILIEADALERVLGEARAGAALRYWEADHYRALYRLVREERGTIAAIAARTGLALTAE